MKDRNKQLKWLWYGYLLVFFGLVVYNLDKIPVAWLDETFGLDPSYNLAQKGSYTSKIWAHPGTENVFLAYLPFLQVYLAAFLTFLPAEIFWVRLTYVLAFAIGVLYLWKIYQKPMQLGFLFSIILMVFFINDQGVYESLRSFRSEVLELMLMAVAMYFFMQQKKPAWVAFLLSMVFLTHPSLWVWVGIIMLYLFFNSTLKNKVSISIVFALPVLAFLMYANFDFAALKAQLIDHGGEHMAGGNLLIDHFYTRYWPYYKLQPWVPLLNIFITGYCVYAIVKEKGIKNHSLEVAFLLTSVYWLFILAPLHRYNTPNILLMFVLLPRPLLLLQEKYFKNINPQQKIVVIRLAILIAMPLFVFVEQPFISRNIAGIVQREERNPYKAIQWLDNHFDENKKILLVENSIAHYYKLQHKNVDFALVYSVYKYNFNDYDEVYSVTVNPTPVVGAQLVDEYKPRKGTLFGRDISNGAITYYGLKIYKINTPEQLKGLQRGYEWYAKK